MHTVAETKSFKKQAAAAGMTDAEVETLVTYIGENPHAGDEIQGTGGCRKVRVAGRGKGKSGGYRTITFYSGPQLPVFLLAVFSKGEKADLTAKERASLASATKAIAAVYRERVVKVKAS